MVYVQFKIYITQERFQVKSLQIFNNKDISEIIWCIPALILGYICIDIFDNSEGKRA